MSNESVTGDPSVDPVMKKSVGAGAGAAKTVVVAEKKAAADVSVTGDPTVDPVMKKSQQAEGPKPKPAGQVVEEKKAEWQRPDVHVAGQTTDRIDDHLVAWMRAKADEGVVKTSADKNWQRVAFEAHRAATGGRDPKKAFINKLREHGVFRGEQLKGGLKALAATTALGATLHLGKKLSDRGHKKQAAVIECEENLALIDRIRRASEKLFA